MEKHKALCERNFEKLKLTCMLCKSKEHPTDMCLSHKIESRAALFLNRYLDAAPRAKYIRRNFKTSESKSYAHLLESPIQSNMAKKAMRKNSVSWGQGNKQKLQNSKKKIFQKKMHNEKMMSIIKMQKLKD